MKTKYHLKGLDCPNCAAKIEREIGELEWVSLSRMNLMKQELTVEFEGISPEKLEKLVEKTVHGHEPGVEVSSADGEEHHHRHHGEGGVRKNVIRLIIGGVIFAAGILLMSLTPLPSAAGTAIFVIAYTVLGGDVVLKALKNIAKGRVFDENFLMSLSTVGAFFIGEYHEAVAVMLFYQIGEMFQDMAVDRSRRSISALMDIRPDSAWVLRGGDFINLSPEDVEVGEIIMVKPGERIPLDGTVTEGESMLDTKALTGESAPRSVKAGDEALSGCINQSGMILIKVSKSYGESTVAKIIDMVENASGRKAPTENFITKFARYYTPAVVILALLLAVIPPLVAGGGWADWINRAFVFLVVSCPCALVISVPLAFFGGIGAASKHGVLIKGGNYLEALNSVDIAVFDKTGTLTKGVFRVTELITAEGFEKSQLIELAAAAEVYSNHPIAKSILSAYGREADSEGISDYTEISGKGVSIDLNGKRVLAGNRKLMESENVDFDLCHAVGTKVYVAVDGRFAGCIVISDEIKPDSADAVAALKGRGISKTVMLTGDDQGIAAAVAGKLGIDEYHAQLLPAQKVEILESLYSQKRKNGKLAFVGDGINDAPVLARADIGIAMGALGSDAAIEAADVVLMTDEPKKLAEAIDIARATKRIVTQNIIFSLGVKALFLALGAFGIAGMWEAVFADVGVALLAVLNSMRVLKK